MTQLNNIVHVIKHEGEYVLLIKKSFLEWFDEYQAYSPYIGVVELTICDEVLDKHWGYEFNATHPSVLDFRGSVVSGFSDKSAAQIPACVTQIIENFIKTFLAYQDYERTFKKEVKSSEDCFQIID